MWLRRVISYLTEFKRLRLWRFLINSFPGLVAGHQLSVKNLDGLTPDIVVSSPVDYYYYKQLYKTPVGIWLLKRPHKVDVTLDVVWESKCGVYYLGFIKTLTISFVHEQDMALFKLTFNYEHA